MKMKKLLFLVLLGVGLAWTLPAQELNFTVKINTQKLQTVDPRVFETLEQTMVEFLNSTKWTEDVFELPERITGNILLTIQEELSATSFKADLAIQTTRPVFGTGTYETPLFNHIDRDISFTYEQFQPLQFSRNAYNDNLSAVLSYYVYLVLGLDYDSFSQYGGDPYFQLAQDIVNNVPSNAGGTGWRASENSRNRFWLIENFLSPRVRPYREAVYIYHRLGLDAMYQDVAKGRSLIAESLKNVEKVNQAYPNSIVMQTFINTKSQELIELFKRGTTAEKDLFVRVMSRIDAPNANLYRSVR